MSDVERYIETRKKRNPKFAGNFEAGYEAFEFSVMLRQARERAGISQERITQRDCGRRSLRVNSVQIVPREILREFQ